MCLAVATAVLIALLFTIMIRYLYQGGKMDQIDWDMSTVTAGDYTVEFEIQKKDYLEWKAAVYDAQNGYKERDYSPALALKEYMAQQIEETLDEWIR